MPFKRLGASLYLTYDKGLHDTHQVCDCIGYSLLSWHFLAIATRDGADSGSVESLIRHADLMAAGVYDGEGFLVWIAAGLAD